MKCPECGSHQSSDSCKLCGASLVAKKLKITEIPKKSKKKEEEDKIYNERRPIFLAANPRCAVFPTLKSNQIHHKRGRVGPLYLDERFWLAVSQKGHDKINNNPQWAIDNGYSELRLKTT